MGSPQKLEKYIHIIAPNIPANIMYMLITLGSMRPLPTVLATAVVKKKTAIKLKMAANNAAALKDKTLVLTMVAIELAESFTPLPKSNNSASTIPNTTNPISTMFDHYRS